MSDDAQVFEVIDRWRFAEGALGDGIRDTLAAARDLLIVVLEREWRDAYGYAEPLTAELAAVQRCHAEVIVDDVVTVGRLLRSGTPAADAGRLLQLRIVTGWLAYVVDMQTRLGRDLPDIEVA